MSWQLKSTDIYWHQPATCSYEKRLFARSAPQRFDVDDPAAIAHLKEEGFAALLHHGNFIVQSHLWELYDLKMLFHMLKVDRSARYWIGCFHCILWLHFETWLSKQIVFWYFLAWDQQLLLCSGSLQGCPWPAGGADGNRPLLEVHGVIHPKCGLQRGPLDVALPIFDASSSGPVVTVLLTSGTHGRSGYLSLFHARDIAFVYHICLEPVWICLQFREWCKLLKQFRIVWMCSTLG